jgi:hypothetical protein
VRNCVFWARAEAVPKARAAGAAPSPGRVGARADIAECVRKFRVKEYVGSVWNWIDWAHFVLMWAGWALWLQHARAAAAFDMRPAYRVLAAPASETRARFFKTDPAEEAALLGVVEAVRGLADGLKTYSAVTSICGALARTRLRPGRRAWVGGWVVMSGWSPEMAPAVRTAGEYPSLPIPSISPGPSYPACGPPPRPCRDVRACGGGWTRACHTKANARSVPVRTRKKWGAAG